MNAKTFKFYKGIFDLAQEDYLSDPALVEEFIENTLDFDFAVAFELWDFLITDSLEVKPSGLSRIMGDNVFRIFYGRSAARAVKMMMETPSVKGLLYNEITKNDVAFDLLVNYLAGVKTVEAEDLLKILVKHPQFGIIMKLAMEKLFAALAEKNGGVVVLPRKLSALLTAYVAKIKTDERPLLEQRIKEIQN